MTGVSGGSPYGASTLAGSDGSLALCDRLDMRYFTDISLRHWLDPLRPPRLCPGRNAKLAKLLYCMNQYYRKRNRRRMSITKASAPSMKESG